MIEVVLKTNEKVIKETLTRIGIANRREKILYPSCYLYSKNDKNYIVHFKQLFLLIRDNGYNNMSEEDLSRRNAVIFCLKNWGLLDVNEDDITPHDKFVFVLPHEEKRKWKISHKFNMAILHKQETDNG